MKNTNYSYVVALAAWATIISVPPAHAEPPLCDGPCLLTGGPSGDYYRHFGPPVQALLKKAWADVPIAVSPGAPASLAWVEDHPESYALIQGDVLATALKDPAVAAKIKVLRGSGIGDEAVFAVVNDDYYNRSGGSWVVLSRHANSPRVRIGTSQPGSGPNATLKALHDLDPNGLGRGTIWTASSMDSAITAVGQGELSAALVVQFANPDNPRFRQIASLKLHTMPVVMPQMKDLKFPDGTSAYRLCDNVQTGVDKPLQTACTPIQLVTGTSNPIMDDLERTMTAATDADFVPRDTSFARLWKTLKAATGRAASAALDQASDLASRAADHL